MNLPHPDAMRPKLADWTPIVSFGFIVMLQAIVFVWFMAGLDSRATRSAEQIIELQVQVREINKERGETNSRLVRVETLLQEILSELRK